MTAISLYQPFIWAVSLLLAANDFVIRAPLQFRCEIKRKLIGRGVTVRIQSYWEFGDWYYIDDIIIIGGSFIEVI